MQKHFLTKIVLACAAILCGAISAYAEEQNTDSSRNVAADSAIQDSSFRFSLNHSATFIAFVLPHQSLRNSKSLHNWPFVAFAMPMAWNSDVRLEKDLGKLLTLKSLAGANLSFMDFGVNLDATLELMHLLEFGISGNVHTSLNYGETATFMGVYDVDAKDYHQDNFFTEFAYGFRSRVSATLPLLVLLPKSDWTKIILRPNASWIYTQYTGAHDGDIWKCGADLSTNGLKYNYGATLIYMLPFSRVPMAMVNAGVDAYFKSTRFDEVYDAYDPHFKKITIMPMLTIKLAEKWDSMLMGYFSRDRSYTKHHFEPTEELLQERSGSNWNLRMVMMTFTRRF